jgi:hypothetical protein
MCFWLVANERRSQSVIEAYTQRSRSRLESSPHGTSSPRVVLSSRYNGISLKHMYIAEGPRYGKVMEAPAELGQRDYLVM